MYERVCLVYVCIYVTFTLRLYVCVCMYVAVLWDLILTLFQLSTHSHVQYLGLMYIHTKLWSYH